MTPIPNKFMEDAIKIIDEYIVEEGFETKKERIRKAKEAIAQALTAAEERGRKAGLEEAAKVADNFICLHRHEPMCRVDSHRDLIAQAIRSISKSEVL